jgi:hypothetical protein
VWWAALLVVFLGAGPVFLVAGIRSLHHAHQIQSSGVATTAMVVDHIQLGTGPCQSVDVSYTTVGGQAEQGSVDVASCPPVGSSIRVVYDRSAVNVVQLAATRGSTSHGWSAVVAGVLLTVFAWGILIWSVLRRGLPRPPGWRS